MPSRPLLALAAAALLLGGACADLHRGPAPLDGGGRKDGAQGVDSEFEKLVYPTLERNCADCHAAGGFDTAFVLTGNASLDRAMVLSLVTPGNPEGSRLLMQATSDSHGGGQRFTPDSLEYQTIAYWIMSLPAAAK